MTVNYTAAQSEMMLPLLRRMGMRREGKREGSWHGTGSSVWSEGEPTSLVRMERARAVSPKLRNHFPPSIMAAAASAGGGGEGEEGRRPRGMIAAREVSWQ